MYVVRRPFRAEGKVMLPGAAVAPESIKRFNTKLKDRKIIQVTAQNYSEWAAYFKDKYHIKMAELPKVVSAPVKAKPAPVKAKPAPVKAKPAPVKAKPVEAKIK